MAKRFSKNLKTLSWTASILLAAVFFSSALAAEEAQIEAAIKDLSVATGQSITSEEQARTFCNQEQNLDVCADIGKKHALYEAEELKHVDNFLAEVKGKILDDIKSCTTEECLVKVASELAQKIQKKNPDLASSLKITTTIVAEKQAVVDAAKEAGVNFRDCEAMNPDTAPIELLRKCAKLAKDSRVQNYIPEEKRVLAAQFEDSATLKLREALTAGKYQCGDGTLEGCGNFCLNPSGTGGIPTVCSQIASEIFGQEGVKQLETARQQVGQVKDYYSDKFILTLPDGSKFAGERQIRDRCDRAFSNRNLEVAKACGSFAVKNGFVSQAEVDKGLKLMESFAQKGQNTNFNQCVSNPASCRDFIPEEDRGRFDAGSQIFEIMRTEIGFDPQQCERGAADEAIGTKCFEGSKRALAKIESLGLAKQSREAGFIIEDIKRHVNEGENLIQRKDQFKEVFSRQGGPGGCKSEGECFSYCSDPKNGPECISFGAQQGVSGFRGQEAIQKFQEYNQNVQRSSDATSNEYRAYPSDGRRYQQFPGQGPYPGFQPSGQGGLPPGQIPGFNQPGPGFGGPAGPSPECFAAIQSGDFVKAKTVCETHTETFPIRQIPVCPANPYVECPVGQYRESFRNNDGCWVDGPCKSAPTYSPGPYPTYSSYPTPSGGTYPSCPSGQWWDGATNRCTSSSSCGYGSYWDPASQSCRPSGSTYSPGPYPTSTSGTSSLKGCFYTNASKNGTYPGYTVWCEADYYNCHQGDRSGAAVSLDGLSLGAPSQCESGWPTSSYTPNPSYSSGPGSGTCSSSLINLLGSGCHQMYYDSSGRTIFCDNSMTKSAKEGDTVTTAGCYGPSSSYLPPSGSPYPSYTPTSSGSCPSGSHTMNVNQAGGYCMSDNDSLKCGPLNSTSTSTFGSCSSYTTTSSYSPPPSCPSGQWWDYARNSCQTSTGTGGGCGSLTSQSSCISQANCKWYQGSSTSGANTSYCYYDSGTTSSYTPYPTATSTSGNCPTGSHSMGSYCMSDNDSLKCGPLNSTSTSTFGSCSSYTTTTSYSPYPTSSTGTSCGSGYYWDSATSSCRSSCPSGQWWDTSIGACKSTSPSDTVSPTTSYTPYPTSTYTPYPTATYAPTPPVCTSTQYWNGSSCVENPPASTYTPPPYTPPPTCSSGQYWDGSACVVYPSPPPTSMLSGHQLAVANTIMACARSGGQWDSGRSTCVAQSDGFFASVLKAFSRFLIGR